MNSKDKFYCVSGMEDFIDNDGYPRILNDQDSRVLAKIIANTKSKNMLDIKNTERYYILVNENGSPYNPILIYSSIKNKKNYTDTVCKNKRFKKVDSYIFKKYINFLKTKNKRILNNLQRDI